MFEVLASNDGSGISFSNHNGDFCESIHMEVFEGDEVELISEDIRINVIVTNISGSNISGEVNFIPFGSDLDLQEGELIKFELCNINSCTHL